MFAIIGILAGVLSAVSYVPYTFDILKGRARPERASWLIWLVLAVIAFFSQLAEGASDSLWLTAFDSLGVLVTFALSIKFGAGGLARRDRIALVVASLGLVLWYLTHHAFVALFIVMAVDAVATTLTVVKAYQDPASETLTMWVIVWIAGLLAMLAVGRFDLVLLAYPFYIFFANFAVVVAVLLGRRAHPVKQEADER